MSNLFLRLVGMWRTRLACGAVAVALIACGVALAAQGSAPKVIRTEDSHVKSRGTAIRAPHKAPARSVVSTARPTNRSSVYEEEAAAKKKHEEEAAATKRRGEEEAAATKRRGEEEAAATAAKKPSSGVLGSQTAALPAPKLEVTGNLAPVSGSVLVKLPGSSTFVALKTVHQIPFGTVVNATHGRVSVTTAGPHGGTQMAEFFEGEFVLTQGRNGLVVATLTGGNFAVCPTARERSHVARASSSHASGKHVVRKLWANAHGSFSTKGNYAAGAVQGTEWLTEDLCEGTLIRVTRDRVVVTNLVNHRHATVKAGHRYLAKAP
jgi:hypothetical protein